MSVLFIQYSNTCLYIQFFCLFLFLQLKHLLGCTLCDAKLFLHVYTLFGKTIFTNPKKQILDPLDGLFYRHYCVMRHKENISKCNSYIT